MIGELLPDLPDRDNPGLEIAENCLPAIAGYQPFPSGTRAVTHDTPVEVQGGAMLVDKSGDVHKYLGTRLKIHTGDDYSTISSKTFLMPADGIWEFTSFGDTFIAANGVDVLQSGTLGTATAADISGAPVATTVATVRDFIMAGQTTGEANQVLWSAIGDPTGWTVGTQQAGLQPLEGTGRIRKVLGGEYAIIFTDTAIWRATYIGAPIVWQFDRVETNRGTINQASVIQIGELIYFLAADGFYLFDGANTKPIGSQKLMNTFMDDYDRSGEFLIDQSRMAVTADEKNKRIFWFYTSVGNPKTNVANRCMVYQWDTQRWTGPTDVFVNHAIFDPKDDVIYYWDEMDAYTLNGVPRECLLESGEVSLNQGGRCLMKGIRPVVDGTSPTITVAVGSRDDTFGTVTWTNDTTPNTVTGQADFRVDARYHRFRIKVSGSFTDISGVEPQFIKRGRK